jgi:methylamine dehydrogenase accessory protein MauD
VTTALLVSNAVLWVAVVVLACVVAALVRQLGVLYERVLPAGALMTGRGPAVGDRAPVVAVEELAGRRREIGAPSSDGRSTLLFFLAPGCPVCKTLLPALRSAARAERGWLEVVLASDGAAAEHRAFVRSERLAAFPYVLSTALGLAYQVGQLPYAVLVDAAGVVRARGLVNTREHLESLFEAQERETASIQDFVRRAGGATEGRPT